MQCDFALRSEDHEFREIVVRADEVTDEVDLRGDDVDRRHVDVLAISHDVVIACAAQQFHTRGRRPALGDEVDDGLRALGAGRQVQDLLDEAVVVAAGLHDVVGAEFLRERQRVAVAVDHHDRRGADGFHDLDPDVAQAARADHDDHVAGLQRFRGLRAHMVRREARVREGRDIRRLEFLIQFDHAPRPGLQILRVPAVAVDAGKLGRFAMHVVPGAAGATQPARHQRVQDDLVADLDARDGVAFRVHPPGIFMPDRVGQLDARFGRPLALQNV